MSLISKEQLLIALRRDPLFVTAGDKNEAITVVEAMPEDDRLTKVQRAIEDLYKLADDTCQDPMSRGKLYYAILELRSTYGGMKTCGDYFKKEHDCCLWDDEKGMCICGEETLKFNGVCPDSPICEYFD